MPKEDLIWYACYGSNISEQRFLCYIQGGTPPGATQTYKGCIDKTAPRETKPVLINRELYFAKEAPTWNGGGIAFLKPWTNGNQQSLGRMYLISKGQFMGLLQQELHYFKPIRIDYTELKEAGSYNCLSDGRYGELIYLGQSDDYPVISFTSKWYLEKEINAPSEAYLSTIIKGLKEIYSLTATEIIDYFKEKDGIAGKDIEQSLETIVSRIH